MEKAIYYTHVIAVTSFVFLYLVKTLLLVANSEEKLAWIIRITTIPERIIAFTFLASGIYLITQLPTVNLFMAIKLGCVLLAIPLAITGFKKLSKPLVSFAFVLLISAFGLAKVSKKKLAEGEITPMISANGKEIFDHACAQCHGENGKKGLMGASDLSVSKMDQQEIIFTIKNGKGIMVGYGNILSDEQIMAVANYVETLQKD